MGGEPDSDGLRSPSCHQHLWTFHPGQLFLAGGWKDTGWRRLQRLRFSLLKQQDHPCSQVDPSVFRGAKQTIADTSTEHGWGEEQKNSSHGAHRLLLMNSAKGARGECNFHVISATKLSLRAVPLCGWWVLQCGERKCFFSGEI